MVVLFFLGVVGHSRKGRSPTLASREFEESASRPTLSALERGVPPRAHGAALPSWALLSYGHGSSPRTEPQRDNSEAPCNATFKSWWLRSRPEREGLHAAWRPLRRSKTIAPKSKGWARGSRSPLREPVSDVFNPTRISVIVLRGRGGTSLLLDVDFSPSGSYRVGESRAGSLNTATRRTADSILFGRRVDGRCSRAPNGVIFYGNGRPQSSGRLALTNRSQRSARSHFCGRPVGRVNRWGRRVQGHATGLQLRRVPLWVARWPHGVASRDESILPRPRGERRLSG